jgi:predicted O-methyltransferase YrrM
MPKQRTFRLKRRSALAATLTLGAAALSSAPARAQRHGALERAPLANSADEGRVLRVLDDVHRIDADKDGYYDYLQKIAPSVRLGGLIVVHNMASPPPDPRYIEAITTNPAFETIFLNMHDAGVGVTLKKA